MKAIGLIVISVLLVISGFACRPQLTTNTPASSPSPSPSPSPADTEEAFYTAVKQAKNAATVEVMSYTEQKKVTVSHSDKRFNELWEYLNKLTLNRIESKQKVVVVDGRTVTASVTIPYAISYILSFTLPDSSPIRFNCGTAIWFETDTAMYAASFNSDFRTFLDGLLR